MKQKYNKKLSAAERRRVSDAIYRLKKQGFIIPEQELKKIKDASSYKAIYEKAVSLKGAVYSPEKENGKRQEPIPAKIGYKLVKTFNPYERKRKQYINKNPEFENIVPKYNPASIEPTAYEKRAKRMTHDEVQKETLRRAKRNIRKMSKYSPEEIVAKHVATTKDNLLKVLRDYTIKPVSPKLYKIIEKKLKTMSKRDFVNFYERVGRDVMDAMFIYPEEAFTIGTGETDLPIYIFLKELGIDINENLEGGVTIDQLIQSMI